MRLRIGMDPVDYRIPLPPGRNLRWQRLPDGGVRVERDVVRPVALWREVLVPAGVTALLVAMGVIVVFSLVRNGRTLPITGLLARALALVALLPAIAYVLLDTFRNGGVVTLVAVSNGTLYWRKENLWGPREHFWPADTISAVRVQGRNIWESSLRVERRNGYTLNAFAFHDVGELTEVAALLNGVLVGTQGEIIDRRPRNLSA